MDPEPNTLEPDQRGNSADTVSTRPNPFIDSEGSSRKRRRTSASASPTTAMTSTNKISTTTAPTHDSTNLIEANSVSTAIGQGDRLSNSGPLTEEAPAISYQTAERHHSEQTLPEPPSSKVTINLRNARTDSSGSPDSPTPKSSIEKLANASDYPKQSVEVMDDDFDVQANGDKSPISTMSSEGSPPVEVVRTSAEERDSMSDATDSDSGFQRGGDIFKLDPSVSFPYAEADSGPCNTLERMVTYFETRM